MIKVQELRATTEMQIRVALRMAVTGGAIVCEVRTTRVVRTKLNGEMNKYGGTGRGNTKIIHDV
jgi:hypothetical protein